MLSLIGPAAALALMTGEPAAAQTSPRAEADLRCFAAVLAAAERDDDNDDEDLLLRRALAVAYYLGRVDGREPGVDWIRRGFALSHAEPDRLIAVDYPRCRREFDAIADRIGNGG